jgi:peptide/nickel transport system substrate-binding protein
VCLATVLAACEGPPARAKAWHPDPEPTPPVAAAPAASAAAEPAVGALHIRLPAEPSGLDPLVEPDRETLDVVEDTVFETLVRREPGRIAPALAESFRVAGGGNEIRFTLRPGVLFHDGRPFTAADARFSIEAARRGGARLRSVLADVVAVEVWSPRDLRVVLRRPDGYALRALAEVPMLPAALYDTEAGRLAHVRAPVGTGPYRLERWSRGDRIVLERFKDYWGPTPAIATVELVVIPDAARALAQARAAKLDVLPALIPAHWPVPADVAAAFAPLELVPPRFVAGLMNLRRGPFADVRVREAAALLVDRARLARDVWRGLARAGSGPVWPGGPGDAEGPEPPLFDPLRAGLLLSGKKPKILLIATGGPARLDRAGGEAAEPPGSDTERDFVVAALRRGGFVVELRSVPPDDYFARLKAGDFDLALIDYRGRVDEDLAPLFGTNGARNYAGLASKAVDAALADAAATWEPEARAPYVAALGRAIAAEWPMIPLVVPTPRGLVARRLGHVVVRDGWIAIRELTWTEKVTGAGAPP